MFNMNWKEFFKPTLPKIILTIVLPIIIAMIFRFLLCLIPNGLPGVDCHFLSILEFGLGLNYIRACQFIPGPGTSILCAMKLFLSYWVISLVVSYLILSAIFYKLKNLILPT